MGVTLATIPLLSLLLLVDWLGVRVVRIIKHGMWSFGNELMRSCVSLLKYFREAHPGICWRLATAIGLGFGKSESCSAQTAVKGMKGNSNISWMEQAGVCRSKYSELQLLRMMVIGRSVARR